MLDFDWLFFHSSSTRMLIGSSWQYAICVMTYRQYQFPPHPKNWPITASASNTRYAKQIFSEIWRMVSFIAMIDSLYWSPLCYILRKKKFKSAPFSESFFFCMKKIPQSSVIRSISEIYMKHFKTNKIHILWSSESALCHDIWGHMALSSSKHVQILSSNRPGGGGEDTPLCKIPKRLWFLSCFVL